MIYRLMLLAVVLIALPLSACSRRQPPAEVVPTTQQPDTAGAGAQRVRDLEQQRLDSIARANASLADERRAAEEAAARVRAILEERVHFDYDESNLSTDAEQALGRKVPILRSNPDVRMRIVGHADERGSVEYNLALGMRRANAARDYLAGFGIDASRFEIGSMGEDIPLDRGSNEAAWARNRRAEFSITAGGSSLVMPGG